MSVRFACYFPAEKPLFMEIEIPSDVRIATLLETTRAHLRSRGRIVDGLRLFKTDIALEPEEGLHSRALEWLQLQPANGQLCVTRRLELIFPHGPHPIDVMKLDIIIADNEVMEKAENLGDPYYDSNRKVNKALNERINKLSSYPNPSDVIKTHENIQSVFGGNEPDIHLGRPCGPPAVIFNHALATLQRHLDDIDQVPVRLAGVVDCAAPYLRCAVGFYKTEEARQSAVDNLLNNPFRDAFNWQFVDGINPTASWWHDEFLVQVLESKNSPGLDGDASYQAIIDYSKIISADKYKPFREYCNFPIVIIGITANRFDISVAVCVGPIYVTKLLTLDLSLGFHASANIIRLARVFETLSRCQAELKEYYADVRNRVHPKLSCLFPNPTPIDSSKAPPKLTYRRFLSRAGQPTSTLVDLDATTAMYIATLDDDTNQEVIVKFTARYNEAAHRLLANAEFAPTLRFCGRVVGDLFMVVMDRVDGRSIWQLQQDEMNIPAIVAIKVQEAVDLLHGEDIVFGDLRSNNVLYVPSERRVLLVDFDWAGKDGESRYPVTLNLLDARNSWPEQVVPYGLMHKAHDLWQLDRLKELCT